MTDAALARYTVRGPGTFPVDMLRYDRSYPYTEADAGKIEQTLDSDGTPGPVIELEHRGDDRNWSPTNARWRSFGWHVVREGA